jgi:peptide/nickel transport system permease protein
MTVVGAIEAPDLLIAPVLPPAENSFRVALRTFMRNRLGVVGVAIVLTMAGFCFIGPLLYHTDQVHTNLNAVHLPPGAGHPLGTDAVGYDELGRLMVGGQSSLEVGVAAALIATAFGALWGAVAGFAGRWTDSIMMRVVDALLSVPPLLLLLFLATIHTPSVPLLIFVVSLVSWLIPSRLIRGEVLVLRERDFVRSARLVGASRRRIVFRHLIPNSIGTVVVNGSFQVADAILLVASLSYLGLGLPPPAADWGGMLSDGINYLYSGYWWLVYPPGVAIVVTVVGFNFIGDALREALEVRLRQR